jgi:hypothetical protein
MSYTLSNSKSKIVPFIEQNGKYFFLILLISGIYFTDGMMNQIIIGSIILTAWGVFNIWCLRSHINLFRNYIETLMWGKPLTKEYWTDEEWKNKKRRKFVLWKSTKRKEKS